MTDYFALLGQPRHPWLDPDILKDAFHRLAATLHPDATGSGDDAAFSELNSAYSALRDPALRLRHLLELEHPGALATAREIPAGLADLFMRIGGARRRLDAFLERERAADSALARAMLAAEKRHIRADWSELKTTVDAAHSTELDRLQTLDQSGSASGEKLAGLHQQFAYLSRWTAQIREATLALDL